MAAEGRDVTGAELQGTLKQREQKAQDALIDLILLHRLDGLAEVVGTVHDAQVRSAV